MDVELRPLTLLDAPVIAAAFRALGWPGKTEEGYASYFGRQQAGELAVLVAWLGGQFLSYGCVSFRSEYPVDDSQPSDDVLAPLRAAVACASP